MKMKIITRISIDLQNSSLLILLNQKLYLSKPNWLLNEYFLYWTQRTTLHSKHNDIKKNPFQKSESWLDEPNVSVQSTARLSQIFHFKLVHPINLLLLNPIKVEFPGSDEELGRKLEILMSKRYRSSQIKKSISCPFVYRPVPLSRRLYPVSIVLCNESRTEDQQERKHQIWSFHSLLWVPDVPAGHQAEGHVNVLLHDPNSRFVLCVEGKLSDAQRSHSTLLRIGPPFLLPGPHHLPPRQRSQSPRRHQATLRNGVLGLWQEAFPEFRLRQKVFPELHRLREARGARAQTLDLPGWHGSRWCMRCRFSISL